MATGGDIAGADKCAVCLLSYSNPKFLPCFHTFCANCIQGLADNSRRGTFNCPSCRKPTSLPAGGVAALQTNFYIKTDIPQEKQCKIHKDKKLEFYCMRCDKAICLNCKLTKHEQHETDDLDTAVKKKKKELSIAKARLQRAVASLRNGMETGAEVEQQVVLFKKVAVERDIRQQHADMVAAADRKRNEALDSLHSVCADVEKEIANILKQQEDDLQELLKLQHQLKQTVSSGTESDIISIATEMRSGRGSQQAVRKLTSQEKSSNQQRRLQGFRDACDVIMQTMSATGQTSPPVCGQTTPPASTTTSMSETLGKRPMTSPTTIASGPKPTSAKVARVLKVGDGHNEVSPSQECCPPPCEQTQSQSVTPSRPTSSATTTTTAAVVKVKPTGAELARMLKVWDRVRRGSGWMGHTGDVDGTPPRPGTVAQIDRGPGSGVVLVRWDVTGETCWHDMGLCGHYELELL